VLTISTVCTETIFFDIEGICGGVSHLRLSGGTAVSRAMQTILASEPDSKTRNTWRLLHRIRISDQTARRVP
jgi:hypothetical protein